MRHRLGRGPTSLRDVPALTLGAIVGLIERRYPLALAEDWDAVGLVAGDPDQEIRRVLFAVDPVEATATEAVAWGADLLLTHHPLFLTAVHSVAATSAKGRVIQTLLGSGCGLYAAHTNADSAPGGVADCLAEAVGLQATRPLLPAAGMPLDLLVTYVPVDSAQALVAALSAAGAGEIGDYEQCAWSVPGDGQFLPGPAAHPAVGQTGHLARVRETRIEMVLPPGRRGAVVAALRAAHPYEEPAFSVLATADVPAADGAGTGRLGELRGGATTLGAFARAVAAGVPATAQGVRVSGDLDAVVRTVAVCGGSGGSLVAAARAAGADVLVTADQRHHPTSEAREEARGGRPFLVDLAHWASEWPWLPRAAAALRTDVAALGATVETRVSTLVTDPWTAHVGSGRTDDNGLGDPPYHPQETQ